MRFRIADYVKNAAGPLIRSLCLTAPHPPRPKSTTTSDVPGLLEGAHEGHGLGHRFLRHVQRCRALVHVLDGTSPDPVSVLKHSRSKLSGAPGVGAAACGAAAWRHQPRSEMDAGSSHAFFTVTRVTPPGGRLPRHQFGAGAVQPGDPRQAAGENFTARGRNFAVMGVNFTAREGPSQAGVGSLPPEPTNDSRLPGTLTTVTHQPPLSHTTNAHTTNAHTKNAHTTPDRCLQ